MIATVLDTKTGETVKYNGPCAFEWVDGNWSCDCNRKADFDVEPDCVEGFCEGGHRFLVIDAKFGSGEHQYSLYELNECYPEELLTKHGITKP